ncbi:MAG: ABC transporter ATP-binding protein [Clostridia bacterium]|nr:ABC transporter ATP-binding protein [Clostridia bacterium]
MANKTEKKKKPRQSVMHIVKNNLYMLRKLAKYAPDYIVIKSVTALVSAANSIYTVSFTKTLYDTYMRDGARMADVVRVVIPFLIFQVCCSIIRFLCSYIFEPKSKQRLQYKMQGDLYAKARDMDISCYDDPEFYNSFVWAMTTADGEALGVVDKLSELASCFIGLAGVLSVLATIEPLIIAIIGGCVVFSLFIRYFGGKIGVAFRDARNPIERRREYSMRVFYLADYAKEIRMSRISDRVLNDYEKALDEETALQRKFGQKTSVLHLMGNLLIEAPLEVGITLLMIWRIIGGTISLGDYAAVTETIWMVFWRMRRTIETFGDFAVSSLYIDKFRTFVEYENKIKSGPLPLPPFEDLRIRGVDFAYPSNEENTLNGVDIEIKRGEKIAIVGYNGAGKTTLIKLLMRLYDPSSGAIEYNGVDAREYDLTEYRSNFGTIFQDYKVFAATIAENVLGEEYSPDKEQIVLDALHRATFDTKLEGLDNGIQTELTREFDEEGVNLSGGEAQKIAIARAFARECDIIIMDEPSSALDPISEYELNHSIKDNARDKTVIFISHRLSTTRMADRIYMFEDGRVVEHGTHDELMEQGGKYAYMFELQAQKYRS